MKKTTTKLQLKRETVRMLASELSRINGGCCIECTTRVDTTGHDGTIYIRPEGLRRRRILRQGR